MALDPVRGRSAGPPSATRAKRRPGAFAGHLEAAGAPGPEGEGIALLEPSPPDAAAAAQAGRAAAAAALHAAGLQQDPREDAARNRRARDHGRALLDALVAVQTDLLRAGCGSAQAECLDRLAGLAEEAPEAADPALESVLREIKVRAAVTLAQGASRGIVAVG